jgi:membrane-associated phospholipid phosphatase
MPLFRFEGVASAYFVLLALSATVAPVPFHRRARAIAASCLVVLGIVAAVRTLPDNVRVWLPHLYLALGYWLPSMITGVPNETRFEAWLRRHDAVWRHHMGALSPLAAGTLELAYLACFVVVPLAFVAVWTLGTAQQIERFWVAVLLSGFACYITLPWLVSRPPRMFEDDDVRRAGLASFNVSLVRRVSHGLNTFPSGHVAVATAVALTVCPVSGGAGVLFGIVAVGIALGAVTGRYHYGIDVLAGALVGVAAAIVA